MSIHNIMLEYLITMAGELKDEKEALKWFKKAAQGGDTDAGYYVAGPTILEKGHRLILGGSCAFRKASREEAMLKQA